MAKKGKLRGALTAHTRRQEQKVKSEAAVDAQKRKFDSIKHGGSDERRKRRRTSDGNPGLTPGADEHDRDGAVKQAPARRRKAFMPFARDDSILLVGEGNFSFTLSLLQAPHSLPPSQIVATAYDSEQECYRKYPDAKDIVTNIREIAKTSGRSDEIVLFNVDAGNLTASKAVTGSSKGATSRRFSKIWFGFPHVGAGHKDETRNILANQLLFLRFLVSAAPLLSSGPLPAWVQSSQSGKRIRKDDSEDDDDGDDLEDGSDSEILESGQAGTLHSSSSMVVPNRAGSVLITLRDCSPYTQWDVPTLAKRTQAMLPIVQRSAPALPKGQRVPSAAELERAFSDPKKSYTVWRSARFEPAAFPGYSHRRTVGFVEGLSTEANEDIHRPGVGGTGECRTWELGLAASNS